MTRSNPDLISPAGLGNFARLKAIAAQRQLNTETVVQRFALEGAIRRIFTSQHAKKFGVTSLKGGALMFFSEGVAPIAGRSTSDIDIQLDGFDGTMDELADIMRQVLAEVPGVDDGVRFDVDALRVIGSRDGGVPGGAVTTTAQVGGCVVKFKCDVGFYAPEHSETLEEVDYPSLLDEKLAPVRIRRQPIEYAIADKLHAAVQHGMNNTRLRDYYDLFVFCTNTKIDDDKLRTAIRTSWPLYGDVEIPDGLDCIGNYGEDFATANAATFAEWQGRFRWVVPVPDLPTVCKTIRDRLGPVLDDIHNQSLGYAS